MGAVVTGKIYTGQFYAVPDSFFTVDAGQTGLLVAAARIMGSPHYPDIIRKGRGLKNTILTVSASGNGVVRRIWNELYRSGFLKQEILPTGHNRFEHTYFLLNQPEPDSEKITHLTYEDLRKKKNRRQDCYIRPTSHYSTIGAAAVNDRRLTVTALGVLAHFERLSYILGQMGRHLFRSAVESACKLSGYAFNQAWKLLVSLGYITAKYCGGRIRERYIYTSHEIPAGREAQEARRQEDEDKISRAAADTSPPPLQKKRGIPDPDRTARHSTPEQPAPHYDRTAVRKTIQQNISYDWLAAHERTSPLFYRKADIDGYLELITDTICARHKKELWINGDWIPIEAVRERFFRLTADHILQVIRQYGEKAESETIKNPPAYKRSCLYNILITSE